MTNYFSSDLTLTEMTTMVLQALHEPLSGSEAVSIDLVEDTINIVYSEAFTDQRIKPSAREADISFYVAPDTTLDGDVLVGATTIDVTDATYMQSSGKIMLEGDVVSYTGKTANQLTGVTGVNVKHYSGETVRQMYLLSSIASGIEAEQITYLDVNGIPQTYMGYENLVSNMNYFPNSYSVFEGYLLLNRVGTAAGGTPSTALMSFVQNVTKLTNTTDKPSLIPNAYRVPLLVYGTCMKLAAQDAFRTSWDWWDREHKAALTRYIAMRNNRVKDRNNKIRPSIYSRFFNR